MDMIYSVEQRLGVLAHTKKKNQKSIRDIDKQIAQLQASKRNLLFEVIEVGYDIQALKIEKKLSVSQMVDCLIQRSQFVDQDAKGRLFYALKQTGFLLTYFNDGSSKKTTQQSDDSRSVQDDVSDYLEVLDDFDNESELKWDLSTELSAVSELNALPLAEAVLTKPDKSPETIVGTLTTLMTTASLPSTNTCTDASLSSGLTQDATSLLMKSSSL